MGQLTEVLKGVTLPEEAKALVAEADRLLSKRAEQASYVEHLETEIKRLRAELGISSESDGLTFNQQTGTHIDSNTGIHYCTKCLSENKRSPLKSGDYGWDCVVCGRFYPNPDRPPPVVVTRRPRRI